MRTTRPPDDVRKALEMQVAALNASCAGFDKGDEWEAMRLAVSVYALAHDGGKKNVSILSRLGAKDTMQFIASGYEVNPRNKAACTGLVLIQLRVGSSDSKPTRYRPRLGVGLNPLRRVSFKEWWDRDVIFQTGRDVRPKKSLSRKRLVFGLRNKEGGGSHYDPVLEDPGYISASRSPVWKAHSGDREYPLLGLELASMRQVAWEVLETLKENKLMP